MQDIDDFDPLDDILLSDEEFNDNVPSKNFTSLFHKPKEVSQIDESSKEEKKKRMLAELFGTTEEKKEEPKKEIPLPPSKSDWLDLKGEDKIDEIPNKTVTWQTTLDTKSDTFRDKNLSIEDNQKFSIFEIKSKENPVPALATDRRKSESSSSSDLKKSKQRFKSLDLDLELDFDKRSETKFEKNSKNSSETIPTQLADEGVERNVTLEAVEENSNESIYVPSSGVNRRFGTPKRRAQSADKSILPFVVPDQSQKLINTEYAKDSLPAWLDAKNSDTKITISSSDIFDIEKKPVNENITESYAPPNDDSKNVLSTVLELKKKQDELKSIAKAQSNDLIQHEQEIQNSAIKLMQQHRNNISALMQIISLDNATADIDKLSNEAAKNKMEKLEILVSQLQLQIIQRELEKSEFELKLQHFQNKYNVDLSTVEDLYRYKLQIAEEKEMYLRKEMEILEEEYNAKILRHKENEQEIVHSYKEKIRLIQEEHLNEVKYMAEYHDFKSGMNKQNGQFSKDLTIKEFALEDRHKELLELEERLNHQKITLEGKIAAFEAKIEDFEVKNSKEKVNIEQNKKDLKLAQTIFEEKEKSWERENQREKEYLHNYKRELETIKENLLKDEKKLMKEKFELSTEKARLEAILNLDGAPGQIHDILRNKAEIQGHIEEIHRMKSRLESERDEVKKEERRLKEESWRLKDIEQQLVLQNKHFQKLLKESEMKREEGAQALKKAQRIESQMNMRMEEIEQRLTELNKREEQLTKEKIQISKDREILNKQRFQLDMILPQLSYEEQLPFNMLNKNIIDPKIMIMKLKAENDMDTLFGNSFSM